MKNLGMARVSACVLPLVLGLTAGCENPTPASSSDAGSVDAAVPEQGDAGLPDASVVEDAGPPVRTVTSGHTMFGKTSVDNLLVDPLFKSSYNALGFLPLVYTADTAQMTYASGWDSVTPSRSSGGLAQAREEGNWVMMVAMFTGGKGPFHAEVWATTLSDAEGAWTENGSGIEVKVGQAWFAEDPGQEVYKLQRVATDDVMLNGTPWFHYVGRIDKDLPTTCVFTISTTDPGRNLLVAGPQMVPEVLSPTPAPARMVRTVVPMAQRSRWDASMARVLTVVKENAPQMDSPIRMRPRVWAPNQLRQLPSAR